MRQYSGDTQSPYAYHLGCLIARGNVLDEREIRKEARMTSYRRFQGKPHYAD